MDVEKLNSHGERLAVVEARLISLENRQEQILKKLDEIHNYMIKYKGFLGALIFLGSAIYSFVIVSKDWIINHLK